MLQKFRNFLMANPILSFALLSNFLLVSCTKDQKIADIINSESNQVISSPRSVNLSGQELFDGVVFGMGSAGVSLGKNNDIKQLLSSEVEYNNFIEVKNDLYKSINSTYPDYFNNFKKVMLSKDLYKIQQELKNIGEVVRTSLNIDISKTSVEIATTKGISTIDYNNLLKSSAENKATVKKMLKETLASAIVGQTKGDDHSSLVVFVLVLAVAVIAVAVLVFSLPLVSNSNLYMDNLALSISNNL